MASVDSPVVEGYVPVDNAELFCRERGSGRPLVVVHGGPDFDHAYLLPEMDRLADTCRLIYYDQRALGRSRGEWRPQDITIERWIDDLEQLREHFGLDSFAILGHSWGAHVALQYALRHPDRLSRLMLMNSAPACYEDFVRMGDERRRRNAARAHELRGLESSTRYADGDPDAVADYYRIVFATAFRDPRLIDRLQLRWRTKEHVLRSRDVERRLMERPLYWSPGFTIVPALERLRTPTWVVHGDHDFVAVESAARIANAIAGARLVILKNCGHFAYIEAPDDVHRVVGDFLA